MIQGRDQEYESASQLVTALLRSVYQAWLKGPGNVASVKIIFHVETLVCMKATSQTQLRLNTDMRETISLHQNWACSQKLTSRLRYVSS